MLSVQERYRFMSKLVGLSSPSPPFPTLRTQIDPSRLMTLLSTLFHLLVGRCFPDHLEHAESCALLDQRSAGAVGLQGRREVSRIALRGYRLYVLMQGYALPMSLP